MKTTKRLYRVTLNWENTDEGDYCTKVWAKDHDAAVFATAVEMADEMKRTGKGRKEFIDALVANASAHSTDDVLCCVRNDLHDLLAGPNDTMSKEATHVYRVILDLLALRGLGGKL